MIKLTLQNMVQHLVKIFPEFKNYKDFDVVDINDKEASGWLVVVFGDFLVDYIKNHVEQDRVTQKIFKFLNEQYNERISEKDALDYLSTEVFESIATSRKAIKIAQKYLTGNALANLNGTLEWYQPLNEDT